MGGFVLPVAVASGPVKPSLCTRWYYESFRRVDALNGAAGWSSIPRHKKPHQMTLALLLWGLYFGGAACAL